MQVKNWAADGWLPGETLVRPADAPGNYLPIQEVEVFAEEANRPAAAAAGSGGGGRGRGRPRNAMSVDHTTSQADINRFFGVGGGGSAAGSSY